MLTDWWGFFFFFLYELILFLVGGAAPGEEYPRPARPRGRSQEEEGRKEGATDEREIRRHRAAQTGQQVSWSDEFLFCIFDIRWYPLRRD